MALIVHLYDKKSKLYDLHFVEANTSKCTIVTPNPKVADNVRQKLNQRELTFDQDVITISKFIKDKLELISIDYNLTQKDELMLHLGTVWQRYFPDTESEVFFHATKLLTELRGYTLNYELIHELLGQFDQRIEQSIKILWQLMQQMDTIDEHRSYALLTETLRQNQKIPEEKLFGPQETIVFWGFNHLSGVQVDLLKAIGLHVTIAICIPQQVYDSCLSTDWPLWLEVGPPTAADTSPDSTGTCNVVHFAKNRMNQTLSELVQKSYKAEPVDIFLAHPDPCLGHISEVPFSDFFFKTQCNVFGDILKTVMRQLKQRPKGTSAIAAIEKELLHQLKTETATETETETVSETVSESDSVSVCGENGSKNFRKIKVLTQVLLQLKKWHDLSDDNIEPTNFDLKVIEYICGLNSPRTFEAPILKDNPSGVIKGLDQLESFRPNHPTLICATSYYKPVKGTDSLFTQEILKQLAVIGPIKSKVLEFQFIKHTLQEALESKNTTLLIENGLADLSLGWNELLFSFGEQNLPHQKSSDGQKEKKAPGDVVGAHLEAIRPQTSLQTISATRLQAFIDCPRSYQLKYLAGFFDRPKLHNQLRTDQLGILEHELIQTHLLTSNPSRSLNQLARSILDNYLQNQQISLNKMDYQKVLLELENYGSNGVEFLQKLQAGLSGTQVEFERPVDPGADEITFSGRVDCVVKNQLGFGIIDFKRSKSSIPSFKSLMAFKKIQLWFYLNHLKTCPEFSERTCNFFGFLNLAEPAESHFVTDNSQIKQILEKSAKVYQVDLLDTQQLAVYQEVEQTLIQKIKSATDYLPRPQDKSVCQFCQVKNICSF